MKTSYNPALNNAVRRLIRSCAHSPILTWDGSNSYVVQPDSNLSPIEGGHFEICSKENCEIWNDGELSDDEITVDLLAEWIGENQEQWLKEAKELEEI